jgi:hypothetical protein
VTGTQDVDVSPADEKLESVVHGVRVELSPARFRDPLGDVGGREAGA